jgi:hypothetical protein
MTSRGGAEPLTPFQLSGRVDRLASAIYGCITQGEEEGWVSGLPPDAARRMRAALDEFCGEFGYRLVANPGADFYTKLRDIARNIDSLGHPTVANELMKLVGEGGSGGR